MEPVREVRHDGSLERVLAYALGFLLVLTTVGATQERVPLAIRGTVAVHLRPSSDRLTVCIEKRDLNIYEGEDVLVARLLAPDRTSVETITIPDDGDAASKSGASQTIQVGKLNVKVTMPGIYRLHIGPQAGSDLVFGFETDCPHYVIEGPIFLNDPSLSADVYFEPGKGSFKVTAEAVHNPGRQKIPLYDGRGKLVHTLDLVEVMQPISWVVPGEWPRQGKLWHFHVPRQDVRIVIQGAEYWTNAAESYFPASKAKWMLTPYCTTVYLLPGKSAQVALTLRNSLGTAGGFLLSCTSPGQVRLQIASPRSPIALARGQTEEVQTVVSVASNAGMGSSADCSVEAASETDPAAATSATVRVRVGESPVRRMLNLPIVLLPYQHENAQFGYLPRYPCNPPFFDLKNRPYIRSRGSDRDQSTGIQTLVDGKWVEKSFIPAIKAKYPHFQRTYRAAGWDGTKIVFDSDNHAYTLLQIRMGKRSKRGILLYSPDGFDSFQVYELPRGEFDTEQWTGHNTVPGPPPVLLYERTGEHPARWASIHNLEALFPTKKDGGLSLGEPVLVSDKCIGPCRHSGGASPTATGSGRTHIVWGEVDDGGAPGVPTYVATYFHGERKVGKKVFLAYAPPVNDVHNAPGICLDSESYLHVVTGAHGRPFKYVRSLKPNDAYSGWTDPEEILKTGFADSETPPPGEGRQTYLALVCDRKDTLHIAFRQWRAGVDEYFSGRNYAALSYQRKKKGQPWEDARPMVVAPLPGYSIYYHKMTLDRDDRLYLSYSYYSKDEIYRNDLPGQYNYRAVITSSDGGDRWKLLETADFTAAQ